ncbi:oligosaccharide flippase family protein [Halomicrococcus gelatinilyticus]|uniref:oligosaccharide flippase family protein n=1 Tax=Halomicrococcus gelatinilyticus TaxID=1702103 RepID=UPI002E0FCD43
MTEIEPRDVSIGSEALSGGIARGVLLLIGFLGSIVFARVLGATEFGAFYLLVTLENVVDRPIIGFAQAVKKRLSESQTDPSELLGAFLIGFAGFSLLIVIIASVWKSWITSYVQRGDALFLFLVLFLTLSAQEAFSTLLGATGRLGIVNWVDALRSLLTTPAQLLFVLTGFGVIGMTAGLTGASLAASFLLYYILHIKPTVPRREVFSSLFDYAKYSIPSSVVSFSYDRIGLIIIGLYLGPKISGYFEAALKLTIPALVVGMVAAGVLMPKVSQMSSQGEELSQEVDNVLSYSSIFAIPILFGCLAIADKIVITIYGGDFAPAGKFLVGLAFYRFMDTRTKPLLNTLRGVDRPDLDLYSNVSAFVTLLVVGVPALHQFGAMGMLAGMICAICTQFLIATIYIRKEVESVSHLSRPFISQIVAGIVMFVSITVLSDIFRLSPWYRVFILIGTGATIYFVTVLAISGQTRRTVSFVLRDFVKEKVRLPDKLSSDT